jgi:hypothetical protein
VTHAGHARARREPSPDASLHLFSTTRRRRASRA